MAERETGEAAAADPLADVRERHVRFGTFDGAGREVWDCDSCDVSWPCATARVLAALDAERARAETAEAAIARIRVLLADDATVEFMYEDDYTRLVTAVLAALDGSAG